MPTRALKYTKENINQLIQFNSTQLTIVYITNLEPQNNKFQKTQFEMQIGNFCKKLIQLLLVIAVWGHRDLAWYRRHKTALSEHSARCKLWTLHFN